jgi:pSer/pThr/pTyr-binding forkhead associated (FHA) protein
MSQLVLNGQTFVLNLTKYTIGRGEDCNILLPEDDGAVSRNHALLEVARDGAWVLTDLNSTNGTYLDGQRISGQIDLVNGSKFTIGKSEFKILFDEPATIKANSVSVPSSSESPQIGRAEHGFFDIPTSQPKPVTLSVQRPDIEIVERSEMFDAGLFTEVELRPVTTQQTPNIETNAREVGSNQYVFSKVTEGTGEDSDTAQGALENIELKSVVVKVACALPMISLIMPWIQASALGLSLQGTYLRIFQAIVQEVAP